MSARKASSAIGSHGNQRHISVDPRLPAEIDPTGHKPQGVVDLILREAMRGNGRRVHLDQHLIGGRLRTRNLPDNKPDLP